MGSLATAEPREVASLGLRLLRASEAVADAAASLPSSERRWRGRAADAFRLRLDRVARRLPEVQDAYDAAARALLRYAAELEDASLLARRAAAQRLTADRLSAASMLSGPDPGEWLRQEADRWQALAEEQHEAAARRTSRELRDLADAAPPARAGASKERFWSDLGGSLSDQASGAAFFFEVSAEALAGNRSARDELVAAMKQSWRVWEPFVEIWHHLDDDRGGLALGSAGGLIGMKGARFPDPERVKQSGFLKGVREGELTVDGVDEAWRHALAETRRRNRIQELRGVPLPDVEALLAGPIDLVHHEARGGHTIERHVAKSQTLLDWRVRSSTKSGVLASTFPDVATAEALTALALRANAQRVRDMQAGAPLRPLTMELEGSLRGIGLVRSASGTLTSSVVRVVMMRVDGALCIKTAMLEG